MKTFRQIMEVVNSTAGGQLAAINADPTAPLFVKKKKKFAGIRVFDVSDDQYQRTAAGGAKKKGSRWGSHFDRENAANKYMRNWANRNKNKPMIARNSRTGEMSFIRTGLP